CEGRIGAEVQGPGVRLIGGGGDGSAAEEQVVVEGDAGGDDGPADGGPARLVGGQGAQGAVGGAADGPVDGGVQGVDGQVVGLAVGAVQRLRERRGQVGGEDAVAAHHDGVVELGGGDGHGAARDRGGAGRVGGQGAQGAAGGPADDAGEGGVGRV